MFRAMHTALAALALAAVGLAAQAAAPAYPDRPIRLVIGSAAGSGPDIISRALSERLFRSWGQRIVVDARPGAAGAISAEIVVRSAPDGYTWMMLTSQLLVASQVIPGLKFDLARDFASVGLIASVPFVLIANPKLPARNVAELIELARKSPGALRYGSAGSGASEHLCGVMLTAMTGTNIVHVPYKGIPQAIIDTISGEVQLAYGVLPAVLPHVQAGRVRALGVTTAKRASLVPDIPAIGETIKGYENFGWYSIVVPAAVPRPIIAQVAGEMLRAVKEPEFAEHLKAIGTDVIGGNAAELDAFRRDQTRRIAELVKTAGIDNR